MSYVVKKLSESLRQLLWFAEQKTIATTIWNALIIIISLFFNVEITVLSCRFLPANTPTFSYCTHHNLLTATRTAAPMPTITQNNSPHFVVPYCS
jgi:hypothetical protein